MEILFTRKASPCSFFIQAFVLGVMLLLYGSKLSHGQQPPGVPPTGSRPPPPPVYLLNISPVNGGKTYTLFRNTKVRLKMNDGRDVSGKVRSVVRDSILIDNLFYAVSGIQELRFNPGTTLGVAAAIGAAAGIITIAITADGGKDGERSEGENVAFWGGVGLTVVSAALLVPNYFIKKKFSREEYNFRTIRIGG